jgi:large subunit ribosomal protein L10
LALTKERKEEISNQYREWVDNSKSIFFAEYTGRSMKHLDDLRARLREVGSEFHVVKNTLGKRVFEDAGLEIPEGMFVGSTAAGFAFEDSPATAKALAEFSSDVEFLKIKGGYLGERMISVEEIKALAELPPLPVLRARLLGVLQAPAGKLVRTLAEPARGLAAVVRAHSEQGEPQAAEAAA